MRFAPRTLLIALLVSAPGVEALAQPATESVIYIHAGTLLDRPGQGPRGASTIIVRGGRIEACETAMSRRATAPDWSTSRGSSSCRASSTPTSTSSGTTTSCGAARSQQPRHRRYPADRRRNARRTVEAGFTTVRDLGADVHSVTALRDDRVRPHRRPDHCGGRFWDLRTGGHADSATTSTGTSRIARCARHQPVQRRGRLPPRRPRADLPGCRGDQVHGDRRCKQQHRRRARPAAVRRRDEGDGRYGAPLRPEGGGARPRGGWDPAARGRRRLGRARTYTNAETNALFKRRRVARADHGGAPPRWRRHGRAARSKATLAKAEEAVAVHNENIARRFATASASRSAPIPAFGPWQKRAGVRPAHQGGHDAGRRHSSGDRGRGHAPRPRSRIGSLEPGKDADIIAVATSPLDDVTVLERVRFVMRQGVVHTLDGARQPFPPR